MTPCPQCGGRVHPTPVDGPFSGYGRCRRCAVVLLWNWHVWRILSAAEWERAPTGLDLVRPWAEAGWLTAL